MGPPLLAAPRRKLLLHARHEPSKATDGEGRERERKESLALFSLHDCRAREKGGLGKRRLSAIAFPPFQFVWRITSPFVARSESRDDENFPPSESSTRDDVGNQRVSTSLASACPSPRLASPRLASPRLASLHLKAVIQFISASTSRLLVVTASEGTFLHSHWDKPTVLSGPLI